MAGSSGLEVAHIFQLYGEAFRQKHRLCRVQLQAMRAIEDCRTAVLGGHLYRCEKCGFENAFSGVGVRRARGLGDGLSAGHRPGPGAV